MTTTTERSAAPGGLTTFLRSNAGVSVAIVVQGVAAYAFQIVAARQLGPAQYGGVAGLMGVLLVIGVAQLGLQATAARRIAADPGQVAHVERVIIAAAHRVALGLGLLLLALSPLLWRVLRLDSLAPAVWLALAAVPLALVGGYAGVLQGERRWLPLGAVYLLLGLGRLGLGSAFIVWRPTEGAAMAGVALGLLPPALLGWWLLRRRARQSGAAHNGEHALRPVLRETFTSSQALLGFFVLSSVDIVVARNVLDGHDAGLYAGGLILTKAVLFAPQFVTVIAFPAMSTAAGRRRALLLSLVAVLACGVVAVLGSWLLSGVALVFVGGQEYVEVQSELWLFAVLGTFLAMLQMLVYSSVARRGTGSTWLVWIAVVVLVGGAAVAGSVEALVLTVATVDALLVVLLLTANLYRMRTDPRPGIGAPDAAGPVA